MSRKRKLHQLTGQIKGCYPGQVNPKSQYQGQTFYCLEIIVPSLFTPTNQTLYAFPNLVAQEILTTLEKQEFKNKIYHFFFEKRVRGWRLKDWEELSNQ